jgi:hypothetical protein
MANIRTQWFPEYAAPDGAEISFGMGFYKYIAPTALGLFS